MNRPINKRHTKFKSHLYKNTRYAVIRDIQVFEDMLVHRYEDGSQRYLSDISLLFNQQRLDRMTNNALDAWFKSMARVDSQIDKIRQSLPADAVGKFIKSRYIQSPSELRRWTNYLTTTYKAEYEAALEAAKAAGSGDAGSGSGDVGSGDAGSAE